MSSPSSPLRTEDFLKIQDSSNPATSEPKTTEKLNLILDGNDGDEGVMNEVGLSKEMSIRLFRKILLSKSDSSSDNKGKAKMEVGGRCMPPRPLVPLKFGSNEPRPPSILEKQLLPGINERTVQLSSSGVTSVTSQLTIFYGGTVNVYDNVPIDKAQAIMLLAGESSVSKTKTSDEKYKTCPSPKTQPFGFPSICKLHLQAAELPIARNNSLRRFLEKRHERITNKSPYAAAASASSSIKSKPAPTKRKENEASTSASSEDKNAMETEALYVNQSSSVSLSPFPLLLGYFCPVPANK